MQLKTLPAYEGTIAPRDRHVVWLVPAHGARLPLDSITGSLLAGRWGDRGEAGRAMALSILTHAAGRGAAWATLDRFVRDVVGPLDPHDSWRIPVVEVRAWIASQAIARR